MRARSKLCVQRLRGFGSSEEEPGVGNFFDLRFFFIFYFFLFFIFLELRLAKAEGDERRRGGGIKNRKLNIVRLSRVFFFYQKPRHYEISLKIADMIPTAQIAKRCYSGLFHP